MPIAIQEITAEIISATIAFTIITSLHIVFGELAAKSVALWHPEGTAFVVAPPTSVFYRLFKPLIVMLNAAANGVLAIFGVRAPSGGHVYAPAEIDFLVAESRQAGVVGKDEAALMHRVFKFTDRVVEEVMQDRFY